MNSADVIERLCKLQARVYYATSKGESADCFCGNGGFWGSAEYDGTFENGYRNDGEALKFIEQAVEEKLARMTADHSQGSQP